jgi:hypothetical protein
MKGNPRDFATPHWLQAGFDSEAQFWNAVSSRPTPVKPGPDTWALANRPPNSPQPGEWKRPTEGVISRPQTQSINTSPSKRPDQAPIINQANAQGTQTPKPAAPPPKAQPPAALSPQAAANWTKTFLQNPKALQTMREMAAKGDSAAAAKLKQLEQANIIPKETPKAPVSQVDPRAIALFNKDTKKVEQYKQRAAAGDQNALALLQRFQVPLNPNTFPQPSPNNIPLSNTGISATPQKNSANATLNPIKIQSTNPISSSQGGAPKPSFITKGGKVIAIGAKQPANAPQAARPVSAMMPRPVGLTNTASKAVTGMR